MPPVELSQREGAHSRNKIRILQWNADGVNTKTTELAARLQELDIDIGLVHEYKLAKKNQTPRIPGYSCIRNGRADGRNGGGLLSYIKQDLQ